MGGENELELRHERLGIYLGVKRVTRVVANARGRVSVKFSPSRVSICRAAGLVVNAAGILALRYHVSGCA